MLHLQRIVLTNWGPLEHQVVEFGFGTNALLAPNGSGKSNVIEALQFLVTGELPKKLGWYVRGYGHIEGVTTAKVEGHFTYNGTPLQVTRSVSSSDTGRPAEGVAPKATSRASLKFEAESIKSSTEVTARMRELTGLVNNEMVQAVFVPQGQVGAILRAQPADQLKLFEKLGGAEVCARALQYATKRGSLISVVDRADDIALLTRQVAQGQAEVDKLRQQAAAAEQVCGSIDPAACSNLVLRYEQAQETASKRAGAAADIARLQQELDDHTRLYTQHEMSIQALQQSLQQQQAAYEQAKAERLNAQQAAQLRAERTRLEQALQAAQQEPAQYAAPQAPVEVDQAQLKANIEAWAGTLAESERFLRIFAESGACSVCGSKPANVDQLVAQHQQVVQSYTPAIQAERAKLREAEAAQAQYAAACNTYNAWLAGWQSRVASLQESLQNTPPVGPAVDLAGLELVISKYELDADALRQEQAAARGVEQTIRTTQVALQGRQALLSADGSVPPTEAEYTAAKVAAQQHAAAATALATTQGALAVQEQTLTRDQQALEQLQAEQVRNEANLKVRALLDGLRTVFHHSAIPRDRVVAYMERLNNRIADYATRLHAPFSMYIDPESLRPMAQFADRVEPLAQLSGGQFTLAAWSWHLALYEEHGGQVGFIVMDEPTVALDSANIRNVAEVVQYLNRYCAESGLQFLMVTHESDLASGFVQQATLGAA